MFRSLFKPSPPVAKLIDEKMESTGLEAGEYTIAHYRAFYDIEREKEKRPKAQLRRAAITAVNCASVLRPSGPIYFASDSKVAVDTVRNYGIKNNRSIVTFDNPEDGLHIDRTDDWESRPASDFYSVFVDLYLMANGRCVAYGQVKYRRLISFWSTSGYLSLFFVDNREDLGVTRCFLGTMRPVNIDTFTKAKETNAIGLMYCRINIDIGNSNTIKCLN